MDLYSDYAQEFARTRQNPWHGWTRVLELLETLKAHPTFRNRTLRILDLGCGNGRFAKYLLANRVECTYVGLDKSERLLTIAQGQTANPKFSFKQADLSNSTWETTLTHTFDLVVAFGIMHHIAPFDARARLMQTTLNLLTEDGIFVVAFWRFGELKRYDTKKVHTDINKGTKYFENDFILKFNGKAERFCHFVTDQELSDLEAELAFSEVPGFVDDGRARNENLYRIYQKPSAVRP